MAAQSSTKANTLLSRSWLYPFWLLPPPSVYSHFNLEICSLRKCCEVEKRSGQARHSAATAGVYTEVHEHRITEIVTFAALEIFKVE